MHIFGIDIYRCIGLLLRVWDSLQICDCTERNGGIEEGDERTGIIPG